MRMTMYAVALAMLLVPMPAQAEWYVTPYMGVHFGGAADASLVPGAGPDTQPWNVGVTGGWMKGWLGIDADLAQYPRFFDNSGGFMTETSLTTLMGTRVWRFLGGNACGRTPRQVWACFVRIWRSRADWRSSMTPSSHGTSAEA